jgi:hypothetical protein
MIDENEIDAPRFLGFCVGVPGQPHGRKCFDTDNDVIQLENGKGVICEACEEKLLTAGSWSSAAPNLNRKYGKGPGIVINARTHQPQPRLPGRPTGTARTRKKVASGGTGWRNYPK